MVDSNLVAGQLGPSFVAVENSLVLEPFVVVAAAESAAAVGNIAGLVFERIVVVFVFVAVELQLVEH